MDVDSGSVPPPPVTAQPQRVSDGVFGPTTEIDLFVYVCLWCICAFVGYVWLFVVYVFFLGGSTPARCIFFSVSVSSRLFESFLLNPRVHGQ